MPENLRRDLHACHRLGGWIGSYPRDGKYLLVLNFRNGTEQRVTLDWRHYHEAFCYWQLLERPQKGSAGRSRKHAA